MSIRSWGNRIVTTFKVLVRIGDTDPYVRISQLEDQVDNERDRRREAEAKVEQLRRELATEASLVPDRGVYWREENEERDGPFCTTCYDVDRNLVRMHDLGNGYFLCNNCDTTVDHPAASGRTSRGRDHGLPSEF